MIWMKALRSANMGPGGTHIRRAEEFVVNTRQRANELEAHGLAHRIVDIPTPTQPIETEPLPQNKAAETGPFEEAGGTTGAGEPAPSSPPAPRRRKRKSTSSGDVLV